MLREMQLSRKESKREIQDVVEHSYRRRSLSGRRSHSDHKTGKETEHTSNPDKESNIPERGASTSDKHTRKTERNPTVSDKGAQEFELDHSSANTGYSSTPEKESAMSSFSGDGLVNKYSGIGTAADGSVATDACTGDDQSAADGKESLRGTPLVFPFFIFQ